MHSFLQYQKFRRTLGEQIQRHGVEKVAGVAIPERDIPAVDPRQRVVQSPSPDQGDQQLGEKEPEADRSVEPPHHLPVRVQTATSIPQEEQLLEALSSPTPVESSSDPQEVIQNTIVQHQHANNLRNIGTRLGQVMTGISVRSRTVKHEDNVNSRIFLVGFRGDKDPQNPKNWSTTRRMVYTVVVAMIGFVVGLASSIDSAAIPQAIEEFGVSEVTESLATGLYLVGFGFGSFFAAPLSETVGRNPVYLVTGTVFMIFLMASALSPNVGAQLVFRILAGFFGSTPLTCAGGSLSDLWSPEERTTAFPVFAIASFLGPILGPVIGGFIATSPVLNWRWVEWITLIGSGTLFTIVFFCMPETYAPVLLSWKARHLRDITGDQRYISALDALEIKFKDRLWANLTRPWRLLFGEPIAILCTLYLTVVYIVFFTFLTGFEFIFQDTYGISQQLSFTIFVAIAVGFGFAAALVPFVVKRYRTMLRQAESEGKDHLPPEQRLIFAMMGAPFLPIGIFWMGWTAYPSISIWSPITANVPIGFAIISIFITTYQYLIDAFETHAASALVGLTFTRYLVAGGMIPVSIPFYKNLGVHWTLTVLGCIAAIMAPVPYVFYIFGARIRKRSKYAVVNS